MTRPHPLWGAAFVTLAGSFLLTRSGGYEFPLRSPIDVRRGRPQRSKLKGVVLFFFGAHGEKCRSDDHNEKYQCKNKIMDHWGVLLFGGFGRL